MFSSLQNQILHFFRDDHFCLIDFWRQNECFRNGLPTHLHGDDGWVKMVFLIDYWHQNECFWNGIPTHLHGGNGWVGEIGSVHFAWTVAAKPTKEKGWSRPISSSSAMPGTCPPFPAILCRWCAPHRPIHWFRCGTHCFLIWIPPSESFSRPMRPGQPGNECISS